MVHESFVASAAHGVEIAETALDALDGVVAANHKLASDRGNPLNKLTDAEYQRFVTASADVDDEWVKEVSAKGANGKQLYDSAKALIAKHSAK